MWKSKNYWKSYHVQLQSAGYWELERSFQYENLDQAKGLGPTLSKYFIFVIFSQQQIFVICLNDKYEV